MGGDVGEVLRGATQLFRQEAQRLRQDPFQAEAPPLNQWLRHEWVQERLLRLWEQQQQRSIQRQTGGTVGEEVAIFVGEGDGWHGGSSGEGGIYAESRRGSRVG